VNRIDRCTASPLVQESGVREAVICMSTAERKRSGPETGRPSGVAPEAPWPIFSKYAGDGIVGPLLKDFVADLPAQLSALFAAAQLPDRSEANHLSHRLKGDAATYGYPELAHAAHELEQATKAGVTPLEPAQLARLLNAMQILGRRICDGILAKQAD
jgi:HPt (histidine-containing phosphotransfer) domain-containing protein